MAKIHTVSKENKALFPKSRVQKDDDDERMLKCAEEWVSYYRVNPHLICQSGARPRITALATSNTMWNVLQ